MVLLIHVNTFMLFPALPGVHIVDLTEQGEADPINTALEYFDQVVLGHHDKTPETETHKHHRFVHTTKVRCCMFYQAISTAEPVSYIPGLNTLKYIVRHDNIGPSLSYDIVAPPPKAA